MKIDALKMAVLAVFAGTDTILTSAEIAALCLASQPGVNVGSLNIADSVASVRQSQQYASHILTKVSGGYKVLPRADWKVKPEGTRGSAKQSITEAAVSVATKLAAVTGKHESGASQTNVDAGNGTPDGEVSDAELEAMTAPSN